VSWLGGRHASRSLLSCLADTGHVNSSSSSSGNNLSGWEVSEDIVVAAVRLVVFDTQHPVAPPPLLAASPVRKALNQPRHVFCIVTTNLSTNEFARPEAPDLSRDKS
jgi:hypothetical protein